MFVRNPSIRSCPPERFSNSSLDEQTRPSVSGPFNSSPCKLPLPPEDHASAARFSQQTHVVNNMGINVHVSAATPVQVVDKFIPEHSLAIPPPSMLPNVLPTIGKNRSSTRLTLYAPLFQAALKGDWGKAKEFLNMHPGAVNVRITKGWETALHIAAGAKHIGFVEEVVKLMSDSDLERRNKDNNTALCIAAASGVTRIAEVMVKKNKKLPGLRGNKGITPLYIAAGVGDRDMVWYLYNVTSAQDLTQEDHVGLLIASIATDLFDVALFLIQHNPELAVLRDSNGETALHVLARKPSAFASKSELGTWEKFIYPWIYVEPVVKSTCSSGISKRCCCDTNQVLIGLAGELWNAIVKTIPGHKAVYEKKLLHMQAVVLVMLLWDQIILLEDSQITDILRSPSQVLFIATEFGVVELVAELIQSYPDLIWRVDEDSRSIFHIAVIHRQEKIFRLINDIGAHKDMIVAYKDENKNKNNHCILHLAAKIAPPDRLNIVSGAALQMQRELLWFKEVGKNVQPLYKEMRDVNGKTPRMLFAEEHVELVKEGEKWMKSTASSCMLVATLITTVMFAAIFTVPGGNDNIRGTPIYLESKSFIVFAMADAFALFSSVTSILMFLSILTSRYAEEDFFRLLPQRLIVGLATLFLSIAAMLVAFGATFCIVLSQKLAWIAVPTALIACIPVTLFAFLQFPLLVDIIRSSYGAGIFA
ncbi:Ankyrin repeat-containing protein, putative isoform 2 [Hibiscus syriacus]|uniref:Ankyrin repeat-containing protein, putative isoform 2 n=1 Tax=Hibiscus syriacus TaxID=106335 RepID=A0A6A3CEI3_HIBSY|nr:ankyrin repeat-containing protein ITN1-like [Hibiscus syriacus]KAE8725838.1 Ankyrin repeat-containing protein, putative isoform 2 [Hibiscus syriacus]